jgi:hypothetical protein
METIPQVVVTSFPHWQSRFNFRSCGDLWWVKWHWGRVFPSPSVSAANSHPTDCPHTHHLWSGAGTIGQIVVDVPSGPNLTLPQETKNSSSVTQGWCNWPTNGQHTKWTQSHLTPWNMYTHKRYDTDCIKNNAYNNFSILVYVFVAMKMCFPCCCLVTMAEGGIQRQTPTE